MNLTQGPTEPHFKIPSQRLKTIQMLSSSYFLLVCAINAHLGEKISVTVRLPLKLACFLESDFINRPELGS